MAVNSKFSNLRAKVNTLVQKGQIPEPRVTFNFDENTHWHCIIEMFIDGRKKIASAEAMTKTTAHELALAQFDLPTVQESKTFVPHGIWEIVSEGSQLTITHKAYQGEDCVRVRHVVTRNTSNLFALMQKISRGDEL